MRVQIPAYTDRWMKGDRYGEVVKTKRQNVPKQGQGSLPTLFEVRELAKVKLDKSGSFVWVTLDDCTPVD